MNERNITIPAGGMYQEWSCLMDLVEEDTAKTLEQLANRYGQDIRTVGQHKGLARSAGLRSQRHGLW